MTSIIVIISIIIMKASALLLVACVSRFIDIMQTTDRPFGFLPSPASGSVECSRDSLAALTGCTGDRKPCKQMPTRAEEKRMTLMLPLNDGPDLSGQNVVHWQVLSPL